MNNRELKLAAEQNMKCGYRKYEHEDLSGELALLILEQASTHDYSKSQPLTRAYNTLIHHLKFKGDALDYSSPEIELGEDDNNDDSIEASTYGIQQTLTSSKIGHELADLESLENFEIRNLIDGLAIVKGKKLSDRRKREILQKNADHFAVGDMFGGV